MKGFVYRARYRRLRKCAVRIQKDVKKFLAKRRLIYSKSLMAFGQVMTYLLVSTAGKNLGVWAGAVKGNWSAAVIGKYFRSKKKKILRPGFNGGRVRIV